MESVKICRNGANCKFNAKGICRFHHPIVKNIQVEVQEKKDSCWFHNTTEKKFHTIAEKKAKLVEEKKVHSNETPLTISEKYQWLLEKQYQERPTVVKKVEQEIGGFTSSGKAWYQPVVKKVEEKKIGGFPVSMIKKDAHSMMNDEEYDRFEQACDSNASENVIAALLFTCSGNNR